VNDDLVSHTYPLMRRTLDLLPDGVLIIGSRREVLYHNAAFQKLWRIPPEVFAAGDQTMLRFVLDQLDDPEGFIGLVERLYTSPEPSEDDLTFRDGRIFNRRSVALEAGNGGFSRIWIFTDVTEAWSARVDPLTGLLNRRVYAREFPDFVTSTPEDSVKSVALLDVDRFKRYNDEYGHAAGDAALEGIGDILQTLLRRDADRAFRIGGEEFLVMSRHRTEHDAMRFFGSIIGEVRRAGVAHNWNPPWNVLTLSMGLGIFRGAADPATVFEAVDLALYRAKRNGRNRIELARLAVDDLAGPADPAQFCRPQVSEDSDRAA
jgi:diguanylate cyclase (GGDEF)-like protein